MGKCTQCGKDGDMRYCDNGQDFCDGECHSLYTYRPDMTDATFKADTVIDTISLDGGKEHITMTTIDDYYGAFSGLKVIVTQSRIFSSKQLCGFKTVNDAQMAWQRLKEKKGLISWGDIQKAKKEGKTLDVSKIQKPREEKHVKINPNLTPEQITEKITQLKALGLSYAKDLVRLADLMENTEMYSRQRKSLNKDYGIIANQQKLVDDELDQYEKLQAKKE